MGSFERGVGCPKPVWEFLSETLGRSLYPKRKDQTRKDPSPTRWSRNLIRSLKRKKERIID